MAYIVQCMELLIFLLAESCKTVDTLKKIQILHARFKKHTECNREHDSNIYMPSAYCAIVYQQHKQDSAC